MTAVIRALQHELHKFTRRYGHVEQRFLCPATRMFRCRRIAIVALPLAYWGVFGEASGAPIIADKVFPSAPGGIEKREDVLQAMRTSWEIRRRSNGRQRCHAANKYCHRKRETRVT